MTKKRVRSINKCEKADWKESLSRFLHFKRAQGKSDLTMDDYRRHVTLFFTRYKYESDWLSFEGLKTNLSDYLSDEMIKPATFNNRLSYLKAFFTWCVDEDFLEKNPLHGFRKRRDQERVVTIDSKLLKRLLDLPDKQIFAGLRDYTLITLTLDTGIRPKEAFSLIPNDFDSQYQQIVITAQKAKTRVTRVLPLSPRRKGQLINCLPSVILNGQTKRQYFARGKAIC